MSDEFVGGDLRICHVITGLSTGGAQRQLERLVSAVPAKHLVVSLGNEGDIGPRLQEAGVDVQSLGLRGVDTWAGGWVRLGRCIRTFRPNLIQGWLYHGNMAAVAGAFGRKMPVYWNVRHSINDLSDEPAHTRKAIRASVRFSSQPMAIVYNSETAAQQHEHLGYPAGARHVIPNGFDVKKLQRSVDAGRGFREEIGIPVDDLVVGVVARHHPMKNHRGFLEAAKAVAGSLPRVHFVLAGSGVDQKNRALVELSSSQELAGKVHLLGERADLVAMYSSLDILCCPSSWGEAFPNVVGEAMACEVPCVVTDVGDASRIVGPTGLAVPIRDPGAMAEALVDLLQDAKRRHEKGKEARRRVESMYGLSTVADAYARLWKRDS